MDSQQVAILGLGLIGSSLGLALRQDPQPPRVMGYDVDPEVAHAARERGAIDQVAGSPSEACAGADIVILAAPVRSILALMPEVAGQVESGCLVTDTGGTKAEVVRRAEEALPAAVGFVGGHPLAGRLRSGLSQADARLFVGSLYCLTPSSRTPDWAIERAGQLVKTVGAQPYFLDAAEHDALLAAVSHLPYFAAVGLVRALTSQSGWAEMSAVAAGGFRTASSLVDGNPQVWADIAGTNADLLAAQLGALISALTEVRDMVASHDDTLAAGLAAAHRAHQQWLQSRGEAPAPPPAQLRASGWRSLFRRR